MIKTKLEDAISQNSLISELYALREVVYSTFALVSGKMLSRKMLSRVMFPEMNYFCIGNINLCHNK